ncbi:MAG: hypothetical protein ABI824_12265, partial [Acidobacteriota bacterium]
MIRFAMLVSSRTAGVEVARSAQHCGFCQCVYSACPIPQISELFGALSKTRPDVILFDIEDWQYKADTVARLSQANPQMAIVGLCSGEIPQDQAPFERVGMVGLLSELSSPADFDAVIYRAVHLRRCVTNANTFAFLPAKAGSGCSTVAVNTAAALANRLDHPTLLIETDRRSGVLSINLNAEDRAHLSEVLSLSNDLTGMVWRNYLVSIGKLDLLLSNPSKPGPLPSWVNYYQLLLFIQTLYSYVVADLPEVINPATVEVARCARGVFIICEPELASLKLASLRRSELEAFDIPAEKIRVIVNRWERGRVKETDVEAAVGGPIFATLPNDY